MLAIQNTLIHDDVVKSYFKCNLAACKGACCWEGDMGAPLQKEEIEIIDSIIGQLKPLLSDASLQLISQKGFWEFFPEMEEPGTALHPDGKCVFLHQAEDKSYRCAIETTYNQGKINFRKPISCHLYPIRRDSNPEVQFDALNYDRWEICDPACQLGEKEQIPLYQFAKEAIVRAYGESFYDELDAAVAHLES